jgi:hypothetical protein
MSRTDKDVPWEHRVRAPKKRHGRLMRHKNNFMPEWAACCTAHDNHALGKSIASARAIEKRRWVSQELGGDNA